MDTSQSIRIRHNWVIESDIQTIQQALDDGAVTSEELVLFYLDRISIEGQLTNAILEVNPHALQIARALDFEILVPQNRNIAPGQVTPATFILSRVIPPTSGNSAEPRITGLRPECGRNSAGIRRE